MSEQETAALMARLSAVEARLDRHLTDHNALDKKLDGVLHEQAAMRAELATLRWVLGGGFGALVLSLLTLAVTVFLAAGG